MRRRSPRSRPAALVAAALSVAALAACAPVQAGSAAIVGDRRITTDSVRSTVDELVAQSPQVERTQALGATVSSMVEYALVDELAARQRPPVTVSDAEIAAARQQFTAQAGGEEALTQAFLQQRVPRSGESTFLRSLLLRQKIAAQLAPAAASDDERSAAFAKAATALQDELDIKVNPRFGRFDPKTFAVTPLASGGLATAASPAPSAPAAG
ncbi:peptidyl-prolyl cis-trans isomerase SurA [Motilibacter peucedani]|uniref:Peptidyl-prolyl cis-trans isomerase SurA n=1 Tax=Motilibacter peucedani TaxID=598650 RepID=A0A420XKF0_9ACTN|nr:hypothetical protein [Motilibacter peucedani]RKS68621.1 peptidyl-prolyl cis-trans isomerase SurA [Motilibacter peucedani]